MSTDNESDISTGDFASAAKDASESEGGFSLPSLPTDKIPDGLADVLKKGLKARGDGVSIDDVTEEYSCGRGPAFIVRGVTRWTGVDDIPPVADVCIGIFKTVTGGGE